MQSIPLNAIKFYPLDVDAKVLSSLFPCRLTVSLGVVQYIDWSIDKSIGFKNSAAAIGEFRDGIW